VVVVVLMAYSLVGVICDAVASFAAARLYAVKSASKRAAVGFDIVLRARLLGALEVELDGTVINSSPSQRPWAVFAYLALAPAPVGRAELATRFWPDVLDQSARASLRSALWTLRRRLGDRLVVEGERVGLSDGAELWIDAREFDRLAADSPEQALALCRGELLEGIEDDWALLARERHRDRVIDLLERLALVCEERADHRAAIDFTRRQVKRDPFDEEAHRRLITRLGAAGDRAGAVRTYRTLAQRLRRELGVAPSALTRELVQQLSVEAPATVGAIRPPTPGLLPLMGRDRQLLELERAWRGVAGGSGAVAVIRGEAGIGKTRLANELRVRASASGGHTATCAALDLGGIAPFSLWAELIRELLPSLPAPPADAAWPDDLAVLSSELPAHFARGGGARTAVAPDLQRTRLFEAVVALLGWAARDVPLLLVLEDAHSADVPSLELAGYAARRVAGLPVMMVITRRELPRSGAMDRLEQALRSRGLLACELELDPLTPETVAALARAAADLNDADVRRVVARAEGNALLAVETARAFGRGRDEVASSLRGSARATLAPLSDEVRKLVEIAAVAARPIDTVEIGQLSLQDPDEVATQALQTGLLIFADDRIGFRHALLREAVYEEIAEPRRRGLHQRWAKALLASEQAGAMARPAEVARQLRLAGADVDAVPQLARAAAAARAVAALEQAVGYLEEALAIAPSRAELWLELGEVEAWRGRREQAEAAFARALALLEGGEPLALARAWLLRARAYHGPICVPRAVLESAGHAIELLKRTKLPADGERSEAIAARAWAEAVAGSVQEAERLLVALSADGPGSDDLRTYDAGHARALLLMRRGRFIESYGPSIAAGEAIARADRPDLSYGCWVNAASAAAAAGEPERALEFLDRGMVGLAGRGLQSLEIHLLAARSFVLRGLGRLDDARIAAESEQALAEQLAQPELLAMASHDRGLVALQQGRHELAATLLAGSLVQGAPISRPLTRLALAEALALDGRPEQAAEEVRATVLEPVAPSDFPKALVPRLARVQGLVALARDQPEEAQRRIEESIAGWERLAEGTDRAESITTALADLGRPVVGLVEPERELARARADLQAIRSSAGKGDLNAVVP
jgi:DNA-binding SARP family transcriptional activator/tetratricopeptide (TPR) repeat protein